MNNMTEIEEVTEEDEITIALNKKLEEDKKQKRIDEAVDKRLEEHKKKKPREAVFKTKDGKKKKVQKEKTYECPKCGSTDTRNPAKEETIYKYRGQLLSYVRLCNDCGHKWGETK